MGSMAMARLATSLSTLCAVRGPGRADRSGRTEEGSATIRSADESTDDVSGVRSLPEMMDAPPELRPTAGASLETASLRTGLPTASRAA
jgi:hypothetical protein